MQEIVLKTTIKETYEANDFIIYKKQHIPQGPWLDNGSIKEEFYYSDTNGEKLLEIKEQLRLDDGGTIIYVFKNGDKLVIPHNNEMYECDEILRYNNIPLKKVILNSIFKNGDKLVIPHNNEMYECDEMLRYYNIPLNSDKKIINSVIDSLQNIIEQLKKIA